MRHRSVLKPLIPAAVLMLCGTLPAYGQQRQETQQQRQQPQQGRAKQTGGATGAQQAQQAEAQEALAQVHAIGQLETELALGGINQAQTEKVRDYANMLAKSHQEQARQLMQEARRLGIEVAVTRETIDALQQLFQQTQSVRQNLQQAEGQSYDRAFVDAVVQTHEMAISQLQSSMQNVQNQQVKQLMQKQVQSFQQHLQQARKLQQELGGQPGQ